MESFEIALEKMGDAQVLHVKGVFSQETGTRVHDSILPLLRSGKINIIIDFTDCCVVNSLGIASLVDLSSIIAEDFCGKLVFAGLDKLNSKVFRVAGLTPTVDSVPTIADAIEFLKD